MVLWQKKNKLNIGSSDVINQASPDNFLFTEQLKQRTTFIKKMSLSKLGDIQSIQNEIKDGNMTIIDVAGFITCGEFTVLELKRAIEQIRGTCKGLGGALVRLGDRYLIATPNDKLRIST
ncbi:MAG: cell division protein SepF [Promethearchaeota archaeon]